MLRTLQGTSTTNCIAMASNTEPAQPPLRSNRTSNSFYKGGRSHRRNIKLAGQAGKLQSTQDSCNRSSDFEQKKQRWLKRRQFQEPATHGREGRDCCPQLA